MDFSECLPASSGEFDFFKEEKRDSTMSQDLGLDPSDPLNLLLNNNSQDSSMDESSSSHGSPPDWSQLSSSLWPNEGSIQNNLGENMKYSDLGMDFLQMDMDFNQSMAVDPNALHYNNQEYNSRFDFSPYQNRHLATEFLSTPFPFTFNSHASSGPSALSDEFNAQVKERRLSVTSSSESSSGASLSPVLAHSPAVVVSNNDPAEELAQRVRQAAGVMLAVSAGPQYQQPQLKPQAKLPIPRLSNQPKQSTKAKRIPSNSITTSIASSATSSPPPGSPSEDVASNIAATLASATSVMPRPKTSHTTIERRYRTNLNARIQSLRQAVPALRVLEEKNKKPKTEGEEKEKPGVDAVDERGFVDGVKVARKGSKANVLGKAVEYIRVLKKREARLKREQNGLKSLIGGLVGGPALLKAWEHEWREKFGGEEKDEIEDEEAEPMSDDDDGDEEGEGDEDDGRVKKKVKVVKATKKETAKRPVVPPTSDLQGSAVIPEKRKRGRPRKVPAPTTTLPEDASSLIPSGALVIQPMVQNMQPQPVQQYLLATFALFSLFNSPLTFSSTSQTHPPTHSGAVLGHVSIPSSPSLTMSHSYGWRELVQAFHLVVSALVFFSIVIPWLPKALKHTRLASVFLSLLSSYLPHSNAAESTPHQPASSPPAGQATRTTLLSALAHTRRGASDEAYQLHAALGVPAGILGLVIGWRRSGEGFERKGLEQRAWVRLGELVALDPSTSTATRLQTYWCMRSHISWFKASASDLSTLALILYPFSSGKADALWNRASKSEFVRPFERLVLTSLTVDEAVARLASFQKSAEHAKHTPIAFLATILVRQRLLKHASVLFVHTVLPNHSHNVNDDNWVYAEQDTMEEEKRKESIDAGKSLGGRTRELAEALEKVWGTGVDDVENLLDHEDSQDEAELELQSLLSALILYRRIFPSSILSCVSANGAESVSFILSPPPSPSRKHPGLHLALRRALGSPVFDFSEEDAEDGKLTEDQRLGLVLEDARDRVVDMLVEGGRAGRSRSC